MVGNDRPFQNFQLEFLEWMTITDQTCDGDYGLMGKHHKKSADVNYLLSPEEKKRKIRESILAEFQRHFQSEEKTVSIEKPRQTECSNRKSAPHTLVNYLRSSDSNSSMGSQDDLIRRKRRRKTKAERNKARSKSASCQNDVEVKADVNKHLRTAHTVTYPLRSKGSTQKDSLSAITQNRLTKKMGLFNKGKKSGTVLRDHIILTESVRKETEDDLKKILNIADGTCEVAMETDHGPCESDGVEGSSRYSAAVLYNPLAQTKVTPVSLVKTNQPHTVSSTSTGISTCPSSVEQEEFPMAPPMQDIVQQLADRLGEQKINKGRDIAKELCDDLNREMKHNAPRDTTPASSKIQSVISLSGGSSVCRSLLDSFSPHSTEVHQSTKRLLVDRKDSNTDPQSLQEHITSSYNEHPKAYPQNVHNAGPSLQIHHSTGSLGSLSTRVSVRKASSINDLALIAKIENIASRVKQSFKTSADIDQVRANAKDLYRQNDHTYLKREISCTVSEPNSSQAKPITAMTDALDLLAHNDKLLESRTLQEIEVSTMSNKENVHSVQYDIQSNRSFSSSQDRLTNSQSSGFHSHHSSEMMMRGPVLDQLLCDPKSSSVDTSRPCQHTGTDLVSSQEAQQPVLAEYCEDTQYMPKFHGDFYKDSLWFEKTILSSIEQVPSLQSQQQLNVNKETDASSMDILDYLDQSSQASMDVLPHSGHSSNGSTNWSSSANLYSHPPQKMSPDSPQIMFPRRLY